MRNRTLVWSFVFFLTESLSAGVLQLRLVQTKTNGGSRQADSYYEMAGMTGFSVPVDLASGRYYLWATTNVHRKAWNAAGDNMHDLVFPDWPTSDPPCDPTKAPTQRNAKCGDAAGVWYKNTSSLDGNWTYDNTSGGATTIFGFATPTTWPYQWPNDVPPDPPDYNIAGFPGGSTILSAARLNTLIPAPTPRVSPKADCLRDDFNPSYLATGASDAKALKLNGTWYIAANKTINNPGFQNGIYYWTASDTQRIIWGTSADGKTLDTAQELFYGIGEDLSCSSGLLLEELLVDQGYFYIVAQPLYEPYVLLFRAPASPPPASRSAWQMLTNYADPLDSTKRRWDAVPSDGFIDYNLLNLHHVMESGYGQGNNKQASIARVFTSSSPNSPFKYIGITHRQGGGSDNVPELWMTDDLSRPFNYQSDIRTDQIATSPNNLPANGWEFAFDGFPDNALATPRITGNQFDFWLRGVIDGAMRNNWSHDGHTTDNVVYRSTGTLSGDIFAPRVALRTARSLCPAYSGTGTSPCYVGALNGGGGEVNAKGSPVGDWETITIVDTTRGGNAIQSGDQVNLQASNGKFISASSGGGFGLSANRQYGDAWETFTILKVNGSGAINSGDAVALKCYDGIHYVYAVSGGGNLVNCTSASIASYSTFTYLPQ